MARPTPLAIPVHPTKRTTAWVPALRWPGAQTRTEYLPPGPMKRRKAAAGRAILAAMGVRDS